ncbi:MAG: hypothetical protein RBU37_15400 [Myxococcota bacterium]|jgi:hypothetical protein|nr:hypothetical protein [Myxococcota bacterium]
MDPTWAKKLVDRVCADLALKKAARTLRPVGLAVALGTASMLACEEPTDAYGAPPGDQMEASDLYGVSDDDIPETETYPDLYGVWVDETELPPDLYGVADDETEMLPDLYGIADVEE